jgi:hypothetical protein
VGNYPTSLIDPSGLIWGKLDSGNVYQYRWFESQEELEAAGAQNIQFLPNGGYVYQNVAGTFTRLDEKSNSYDEFTSYAQAFYGTHGEVGDHYLSGQGATLNLFFAGQGVANLARLGATAAVGTLFRPTQLTTLGEGLGTVGAFRAALNVGSRRTLAYASSTIEGESQFLISVSGQAARAGTVGAPTGRLFQTFVVKGYDRVLDAEVKILERIGQGIGNQQARGFVNLFVDRGMCPSCGGVANQFMTRFPNVQVTVREFPFKF